MELLTVDDIAQALKSSKWFVYKNYEILGGFKIGKLVRFSREVFENKIEEVIKNGGEDNRATVA